ncbi:MAG TPA: hypothetical protein PLL32_11155 [Anaeromyxobacteraceae bacterium]|nr:hypothetical protein [Anaeromyxobacteraceae bacterium]
MKLVLVAAVLALVGWTPILAAGPGSLPPIPEPVKCLDCFAQQCHTVNGPGYHACMVGAMGCETADPCGE